MRHICCHSLLCLAASLAAPSVLQAKELNSPVEKINADTYLAMSLDELLNIPLTSSTLNEESIRSVPSTMTVYTREQIRELGVTTLVELMDFVPGYQTARVDEPAFHRTFSSRGRRLGSSGREVLILMDGMRLNVDINDGSAFSNPLISLDNVERVEFIRGPGSSIYGSNAIMGVVNVMTRGAREAQVEVGNTWHQGSVQMQMGDNQRGLSLFAKQGYDSGQQLAVCDADSIQCKRTSANKTLTETRDPHGQKELYLRGQWDEFSGALRWSERNASQFYSQSAVNNLSNRTESVAAFLQFAWTHSLSESLGFRAEIFQNQIVYTGTTEGNRTPLVLLDFGYKINEPGAQFVLQSNTSERRWLLGVEYRRPEIYDAMAYPNWLIAPLPLSSSPVFSRKIKGYFGQYQTALSSTTQLTLGLRQDEYSNFGGHLSKRLGLIQQLGERDTLKYLYSTSFRAPSPLETEVINNGAYVRNATLRPEVATNHELIWLRSFENGLLSSSFYTTDVVDAVYETLASNNVSRTWQNGHERVTGAEFEWQQQLTPTLSTRLAVTRMFSKAHAYSGEAANLLSAALVYNAGPWRSSVRLNYQGPRVDQIEVDGNLTTTESVSIGSHTLLGAHVAYKWNAACEIYGQVRNLFDKRYVSPAQRFDIATGVPERGRMVSAGLRWFF